ncbi:hypothetical protein J6590_080291 [Homalodisca vitripennis]|nr:hypothetical protein J6590_080291 [Homalodisca vitripennis]
MKKKRKERKGFKHIQNAINFRLYDTVSKEKLTSILVLVSHFYQCSGPTFSAVATPGLDSKQLAAPRNGPGQSQVAKCPGDRLPHTYYRLENV